MADQQHPEQPLLAMIPLDRAGQPYRVHHAIDPATSKRTWLSIEGEEGAGVGFSRLFADGYNMEQECAASVARLPLLEETRTPAGPADEEKKKG